MSESVEYRTLSHCQNKLFIAFEQDSVAIATALVSQNLISTSEVSKLATSEQNARRLVDCVLHQVQISHTQYDKFMSVFSQIDSLKDLVLTLNSTQSELQASEKTIPVKDTLVPLVQGSIARDIQTFEERFKELRRRTLSELESKLTAADLLQGLVSLPVMLRSEYQMRIAKILPTLKRARSTFEVFIDLEDMFSFIDYNLLKHIINQFCSDNLRKEMDVYCDELHEFMKATTVHQLQSYWPGQLSSSLQFELFKAKFVKDLHEYTLEELDVLRRRFYSEIRLSELIGMVIGESTTSATCISATCTLDVHDKSESTSIEQVIIEANEEKIQFHFSSLILGIQDALKAREVDVEHVRHFLATFFQADAIPETADMEQVFHIITMKKLWSFIHYTPLERLVDFFLPGNDRIKRKFQEYKAFLSGYYMIIQLGKFISLKHIEYDDSENFHGQVTSSYRHLASKQCKKLMVCLKINRKLTELSLVYAYKLWDSIAEEYEVPSLHAVIDTLLEG